MQPQNGQQYQYQELLEIMARLRAPDGCPWDIEQDHQTLMPYLIEETSELIEAIMEGDDEHISEELGDVLLQVIFHAQMAQERGVFGMEEVVHLIADKLVSRHPHVFGDVKLQGAGAVEDQWEVLKSQEKGKSERKSLLDDVSQALPGLQYAAKIQKRAAKVGFDWPQIEGVHDKVLEEFQEVHEAIESGSSEELAEEIGDLLFSMTNYARHLGVDPEIALRQSTLKFKKRFQYMESQSELSNKSLEELDQLWNQAKISLR